MFSKVLSATAVVLAASRLASAQTHTSCDPTLKKCPDNPALGKSVTIDFTKGPSDFFEIADGTKIANYDPALGAEFTINKETDAPTISSTKYILFGTVSVITRACVGQGIVSSIVLQSANLDEIDWEWLGGDRSQVQTNYFGKGDTSTYDRGAYHKVDNPQEKFYNYTIDWTPDYVDWYIDGAKVRHLGYKEAKGGSTFPQTPSQLKLGNWVAGRKDAPIGTVQWAGGYADFSQAPFHAYYKSITISDYHKGAVKYVWPEVKEGEKGDGSWQGIKVITEGGDTGASTKPSAPATSSAASASAAASSKSEDASKTTLSTITASPTRGLTQATDGRDVDHASSSIPFTASASPSRSSSAAAASQTPASAAASASASAPPRSGASSLEWSHAAVLGAGLFLGLLVL